MVTSVLQSGRHRLLICAMMAASLVPIWSVEYFPSQNGPWSLLIAKMLSDFGNPALNYGAYYEHSWHAIPHMLHTLLVLALSHVLPVLLAHKIVISLSVVLLPLSVFTLLTVIDPRRAWLGYASFLFIYNVPLLRGYHDYSIGVPLVLLTYAYWLRHRHALTGRSRAVIMAMTLVIYFSHVFNLGILALAILITTAWEQRSLRSVIQAALLFVLPVLLALEYAWYTATHAEWINRSERVFLAPHAAVEAFFSRFFYTFSYPAFVITVVVLIAWSYLVLVGLRRAWQRFDIQKAAGRAAITFPLLLTVFAAMYFAAPYKFLNWHYANVRFIPYVLVFALACAAPLGLVRQRLFVGSMACAALVSYAILTTEFIRANQVLDEYLSGTSAIETGRTLLPVNFLGDQIGEISPVAHAADYYHIYRGGANGRGMAQFNTLTPLVYRRYPVRDRFPGFDQGGPFDAIGRAYDYVLLWGDPGDVTSQLAHHGFEVVHQQGRLRILRNGQRSPETVRGLDLAGEGPS